MTHHRHQNEKAPQRDRSPVPNISESQLLPERAGEAAERRFEVVAEALDHGNDGNRYAGGDEAIFDGSRARLVFRETRDKGFHRDLAPKIPSLLFASSKGLRTLAIKSQTIGETFQAS
jgi:hypothetical protein